MTGSSSQWISPMSRFPVLTAAMCIAAALIFFPALSPCQTPDAENSANSAAVEEIEDVEEIEEVEIDSGNREPDGLFQTIGRFHPVVLHFPIAWLLLLLMAETVVLTGLAGELNRWTMALLIVTMLSFIPAIVSGLGLASSHSTASNEFVEQMLLHRNFNIAAGVVLLSALVVRIKFGQVAGSKTRLVYFALVLAAAGLMGYGSHLGGEMVWGKGFLPVPF
jgi:uncharacterized membrane protein